MSITPSIPLPAGFEQLSKEQQIDYVQQLWDLILTVPNQTPVPDWHIDIINERIASQNTANLISWTDVKQKLQNKYREC
ncbi:MAG TPA: addiction module protein [Nostocaceae cyanobacterium]|nr:addiction module protein [Nostocaceae cyanobacterium]